MYSYPFNPLQVYLQDPLLTSIRHLRGDIAIPIPEKPQLIRFAYQVAIETEGSSAKQLLVLGITEGGLVSNAVKKSIRSCVRGPGTELAF